MTLSDEPVEQPACDRCGGPMDSGYVECGAKLRWLAQGADLDRVRSRVPFSMVQPALVEARRCQACRLILVEY